MQVATKLPDGAVIVGVKLLKRGSTGFLGIGKTLHLYQIRYKQSVKPPETHPESSIEESRFCLAFFVFNSTTLSAKGFGYYGPYAQEQVLKALGKSVKQTEVGVPILRRFRAVMVIYSGRTL